MANNLAGLADVAREQNQLVEARRHAEEALKCASAAGYLRGMVHALRSLGETTYLMGDYEAANGQLRAALATARELGAQWLVAWTLARLGLLALEQSDLAKAEALLDESLSLCRDMGDRQGIARALEGFGQLACLRGQAETALRLIGAADAIRIAIGVPLSPLERDRLEHSARRARDALDDSTAEAAWAAGHSLSLPEALAFARLQAAVSC
jgi:tetratricopeptide (TPR) repeat protein